MFTTRGVVLLDLQLGADFVEKLFVAAVKPALQNH
jgi:hypothetical protein